MKTPYIFFREDGFYPIDLDNDNHAKLNAELNPGTQRVENAITREIVWSENSTSDKN